MSLLGYVESFWVLLNINGYLLQSGRSMKLTISRHIWYAYIYMIFG
jgi:hypothetical protein